MESDKLLRMKSPNHIAIEMQPLRVIICQYLGVVFVAYCTAPKSSEPTEALTNEIVKKSAPARFISEFEWTHINFTWPSSESYERAIVERRYIPENNVLVGIKVYKERMYVALARLRPGTPVTLAMFAMNTGDKLNPLLSPFPSWEMNVQRGCATLQNVHSMEIDRRGVMWVLDGTRINELTICPPKIVLFDLNNGNRVVGRYIFGEALASARGAVLNDLVLDEADGGYAYITDNSYIDPGLIVFARQQARAWKLRDRSMFPEREVTNISVDGVLFGAWSPINGIALSPLPTRRDVERVVYYTALSAHNIHAISTKVLQNEKFCSSDQWRQYVKHVGKKTALSDGLIIDNHGNMFFGLIDVYGIGQWSIYDYFNSAVQIDRNEKEIVWPQSFAMDMLGYLYLLCNAIHKYANPQIKLVASDDVKMRVMKLYTGNRNYMFTP